MRNLYLIVIILLWINPARAVLITEVVSFDLSTTATGIISGKGSKKTQRVALNPFDSSLGQLDQVRVSNLSSILVIEGTTGRNGVLGPFDVFFPIPYTISPTVKIGIGGVTDFFDITSIDYLFSRPNNLNVNRSTFSTIASTFNLDFRIHELNEVDHGLPLEVDHGLPLIDRVFNDGIPISIPRYSGKRLDFLDSEVISDLLLFSLEFDFLSTALSPAATPTTLNARFFGDLKVEYDYTPATSPVSSVPTPATIYLFGIALIGLVGLSKRRINF